MKTYCFFVQDQIPQNNSDFVTNSYGESWDSSCEKSLVPVQTQWVPVKK